MTQTIDFWVEKFEFWEREKHVFYYRPLSLSSLIPSPHRDSMSKTSQSLKAQNGFWCFRFCALHRNRPVCAFSRFVPVSSYIVAAQNNKNTKFRCVLFSKTFKKTKRVFVLFLHFFEHKTKYWYFSPYRIVVNLPIQDDFVGHLLFSD